MIDLYPVINGTLGRLVHLEGGASPQQQIDATIAKFRDELGKDDNGDPVVHSGSGTSLPARLYQEQYWLDNEEPDEEGNLPPPHYRVGVSYDSDATASTITQLRLYVGIPRGSSRPSGHPTEAYDEALIDGVFARMAP